MKSHECAKLFCFVFARQIDRYHSSFSFLLFTFIIQANTYKHKSCMLAQRVCVSVAISSVKMTSVKVNVRFSITTQLNREQNES